MATHVSGPDAKYRLDQWFSMWITEVPVAQPNSEEVVIDWIGEDSDEGIADENIAGSHRSIN